MSIREVASKVGFDFSNWSKIERGRLAPPTDMEILSKWATVLGIKKGSDEYHAFIDWSYLTHHKIPPDIPLGRLLNHLPGYFRNIRNYKPLRKKDIDEWDV